MLRSFVMVSRRLRSDDSLRCGQRMTRYTRQERFRRDRLILSWRAASLEGRWYT